MDYFNLNKIQNMRVPDYLRQLSDEEKRRRAMESMKNADRMNEYYTQHPEASAIHQTPYSPTYSSAPDFNVDGRSDYPYLNDPTSFTLEREQKNLQERKKSLLNKPYLTPEEKKALQIIKDEEKKQNNPADSYYIRTRNQETIKEKFKDNPSNVTREELLYALNITPQIDPKPKQEKTPQTQFKQRMESNDYKRNQMLGQEIDLENITGNTNHGLKQYDKSYRAEELMNNPEFKDKEVMNTDYNLDSFNADDIKQLELAKQQGKKTALVRWNDTWTEMPIDTALNYTQHLTNRIAFNAKHKSLWDNAKDITKDGFKYGLNLFDGVMQPVQQAYKENRDQTGLELGKLVKPASQLLSDANDAAKIAQSIQNPLGRYFTIDDPLHPVSGIQKIKDILKTQSEKDQGYGDAFAVAKQEFQDVNNSDGWRKQFDPTVTWNDVKTGAKAFKDVVTGRYVNHPDEASSGYKLLLDEGYQNNAQTKALGLGVDMATSMMPAFGGEKVIARGGKTLLGEDLNTASKLFDEEMMRRVGRENFLNPQNDAGRVANELSQKFKANNGQITLDEINQEFSNNQKLAAQNLYRQDVIDPAIINRQNRVNQLVKKANGLDASSPVPKNTEFNLEEILGQPERNIQNELGNMPKESLNIPERQNRINAIIDRYNNTPKTLPQEFDITHGAKRPKGNGEFNYDEVSKLPYEEQLKRIQEEHKKSGNAYALNVKELSQKEMNDIYGRFSQLPKEQQKLIEKKAAEVSESAKGYLPNQRLEADIYYSEVKKHLDELDKEKFVNQLPNFKDPYEYNMKLAHEKLNGRFNTTVKDLNEYIRDFGNDGAYVKGANPGESTHVLDIAANENLKNAPIDKIQKEIAKLDKQMAKVESDALDRSKLGRTKGGSAGALGRDMNNIQHKRKLLNDQKERLLGELDRRGLVDNSEKAVTERVNHLNEQFDNLLSTMPIDHQEGAKAIYGSRAVNKGVLEPRVFEGFKNQSDIMQKIIQKVSDNASHFDKDEFIKDFNKLGNALLDKHAPSEHHFSIDAKQAEKISKELDNMGWTHDFYREVGNTNRFKESKANTENEIKKIVNSVDKIQFEHVADQRNLSYVGKNRSNDKAFSSKINELAKLSDKEFIDAARKAAEEVKANPTKAFSTHSIAESILKHAKTEHLPSATPITKLSPKQIESFKEEVKRSFGKDISIRKLNIDEKGHISLNYDIVKLEKMMGENGKSYGAYSFNLDGRTKEDLIKALKDDVNSTLNDEMLLHDEAVRQVKAEGGKIGGWSGADAVRRKLKDFEFQKEMGRGDMLEELKKKQASKSPISKAVEKAKTSKTISNVKNLSPNAKEVNYTLKGNHYTSSIKTADGDILNLDFQGLKNGTNKIKSADSVDGIEYTPEELDHYANQVRAKATGKTVETPRPMTEREIQDLYREPINRYDEADVEKATKAAWDKLKQEGKATIKMDGTLEVPHAKTDDLYPTILEELQKNYTPKYKYGSLEAQVKAMREEAKTPKTSASVDEVQQGLDWIDNFKESVSDPKGLKKALQSDPHITSLVQNLFGKKPTRTSYKKVVNQVNPAYEELIKGVSDAKKTPTLSGILKDIGKGKAEKTSSMTRNDRAEVLNTFIDDAKNKAQKLNQFEEKFLHDYFEKNGARSWQQFVKEGALSPLRYKMGINFLGNELVKKETLNKIADKTGINSVKEALSNTAPVKGFRKHFAFTHKVNPLMLNKVYETEGNINFKNHQDNRVLRDLAKGVSQKDQHEASKAWVGYNDTKMPESVAKNQQDLKNFSDNSLLQEIPYLNGKEVSFLDNYLPGVYKNNDKFYEKVFGEGSSKTRGVSGLNAHKQKHYDNPFVAMDENPKLKAETNLFNLLMNRRQRSNRFVEQKQLEQFVSDMKKINPDLTNAETEKYLDQYLNPQNYHKARGAVGSAVKKYNDFWRTVTMATVPATGLRNVYGGVTQNFLDGTNDPLVYLRALFAPKKGVTLKTGEKMTKDEFLEKAIKNGAYDSQTANDVLGSASYGKKNFGFGKGSVWNPLNKDNFIALEPGKWLLNKGENIIRGGKFIDTLDRLGKNAAKEAGEAVRKTQFDYNPNTSLTPLERQIREKAVPFYTFKKHNTKFMLDKMRENPNRFNFMANKLNDAFNQDESDPRKHTQFNQDYNKNDWFIGGNKLVPTSWNGVNDFKEWANPVNMTIGSLAPWMKALVDGNEKTKNQMGTGFNLEGDRRPMMGQKMGEYLLDNAEPIAKLMGLKKGDNGKIYQDANRKAAMMDFLPQSSTMDKAMDNTDNNNTKEAWKNFFMNKVTGVAPRSFEPVDQEYYYLQNKAGQKNDEYYKAIADKNLTPNYDYKPEVDKAPNFDVDRAFMQDKLDAMYYGDKLKKGDTYETKVDDYGNTFVYDMFGNMVDYKPKYPKPRSDAQKYYYDLYNSQVQEGRKKSQQAFIKLQNLLNDKPTYKDYLHLNKGQN